MWIISLLLALLFSSQAWAQSFCVSCLKIRVGRPLISRGPEGSGIDNPFNEIQRTGGGYRGFTANAKSYYIDGNDPWSMGGPEIFIFGPGSGYPYNCGRWINDTQKVGSTVRGFIHNEYGSCSPPYNHHKSMSYYTSTNDGVSWTGSGIFLDFGSHDPSKQTGDGDCTVVDGGDGYLYAYCRRHGATWYTFVARAPSSNPIPGNWLKGTTGAGRSLGWAETPRRSALLAWLLPVGYRTTTSCSLVWRMPRHSVGCVCPFLPTRPASLP